MPKANGNMTSLRTGSLFLIEMVELKSDLSNCFMYWTSS